MFLPIGILLVAAALFISKSKKTKAAVKPPAVVKTVKKSPIETTTKTPVKATTVKTVKPTVKTPVIAPYHAPVSENSGNIGDILNSVLINDPTTNVLGGIFSDTLNGKNTK